MGFMNKDFADYFYKYFMIAWKPEAPDVVMSLVEYIKYRDLDELRDD